MNPMQKPEWFSLAEADNAVPTRRISKRLPVLVLVVAGAIIGVGAVVAQTQEEPQANAAETVSSVALPSDSPAPITSAANESVAPAKTTAVSANSQSSSSKTDPVAPKNPTTSSIQNPLNNKPTGGEHEGREGHNGNEHEDDGEYEGDEGDD
jgi:cytoskeletal protein RodZ